MTPKSVKYLTCNPYNKHQNSSSTLKSDLFAFGNFTQSNMIVIFLHKKKKRKFRVYIFIYYHADHNIVVSVYKLILQRKTIVKKVVRILQSMVKTVRNKNYNTLTHLFLRS